MDLLLQSRAVIPGAFVVQRANTCMNIYTPENKLSVVISEFPLTQEKLNSNLIVRTFNVLMLKGGRSPWDLGRVTKTL